MTAAECADECTANQIIHLFNDTEILLGAKRSRHVQLIKTNIRINQTGKFQICRILDRFAPGAQKAHIFVYVQSRRPVLICDWSWILDIFFSTQGNSVRFPNPLRVSRRWDAPFKANQWQTSVLLFCSPTSVRYMLCNVDDHMSYRGWEEVIVFTYERPVENPLKITPCSLRNNNPFFPVPQVTSNAANTE